MKKSKRVLASVMSALLVLPSLALPFSGTAEGAAAYPNADPDEPYYVVGRFQAKGTKVEGASEVQENTGSDAETYPNKVTMGNVRVTAEEPIDLTGWNTDNLALVMDVTYTRGDGKTGNGALDKTGNQMLHVNGTDNKVVAQMTGQPYLTYFTTGYGNSAGKTITYIVPWNYKHTDNNKTSFVKNAEATQLSNIMWQVYNDSWKVDIDGNGKYDDAFELKVAIENARIVDTTLDGEGNKNGIVMDFTGLNTVEVNNAQGQGTPNMFPWAPYKTNNITADMKAEDLQLGFDVMYGGEADPTLIKNGQIRFSALVDDVATEYNYDAWGNGKVTEKDTWYHFDFKLSDFYRNVKSLNDEGQEVTVKTYDLNPMNIQRMLIFNYNGDGNKPLDTKVKNLRIIDTTQLVVPVDRTALDEAVAAAEAKLADGKTYTADTLQALNTALEAAKAVAEDADQAAVDAAAKALTDAIAALKEETTDPEVPENYVLVYKDEVTSGEGHSLDINLTLENPIGLSEIANRDLSLTYKFRVNKTENLPDTLKDFTAAQMLPFLKNGEVKVSDIQIAKSAQCGKEYYSEVAEFDTWYDITIPLTKNPEALSAVKVQFWDDMHNVQSGAGFTEAVEGSKGITTSVKDVYLVIGDLKPVARWSGLAKTYDQTVSGKQEMYANWSTADGLDGAYEGVNNNGTPDDKTDDKPNDNVLIKGVDLSGDADNGTNPNYYLTFKATFNPVGDTKAEDVLGMLKEITFRMRSSRAYELNEDGSIKLDDNGNYVNKNGEAGWGNVNGEALTVDSEYTKIDGQTIEVTYPISKINKDNIDWSDVKQLLIRAALKNEYKPEGASEFPIYMTMTLSDVKMIEVEKVDRTNLDDAIADAEAKLADGKTYTEDSLKALNAALEAAKAVAEDADQATINAAAEALNAAIKGLVEDTTTPVDRTALDEAVAAAEAKLADGKTYTEDSLKALNAALEAAKAVAEDADQATVDAAAKALTDAIAGLVEESTGDDSTPITIDTPSATGHALNISQSIDPAIALNPDKEAYLNFKIRLDKTEDFPETVKDEWGSWLNYIKNGSLKVNGSDVTALTATIGVLKDIKLGEDLDVSVKIPQTVVAQGISSVEFLMYNDLHNFAKAKDPDNADNYTEDNEGSRGVQLSVSDMKIVVGADVEKPDPNAKMIWSAVKGDQTDLLGGTQVYVDWKAADGCSKDNQEGGGVDLSGTAANGANKNYNLQLKFSFKNVNLPEGVESVEQLIKTVFVRLRSTRIDGAEQAADGVTFTLGEGGVSADQDGVYFINIPLSSITTANINWSDVKELILRAEIADGFAVEAAGGTRVENPYFALNISEARVYDTDPEHPDVVNYDALKEVIAAAEAKLAEGKLYTPDSLANLNTALAAAKDALTTTNQDKIDAAAESLKVAMEKLQEAIAYGDVNGDGKVDIVDALMALQASAEKIELTEEQTTLADIDADGTVSAADALMILKVATGAMDRDALL